MSSLLMITVAGRFALPDSWRQPRQATSELSTALFTLVNCVSNPSIFAVIASSLVATAFSALVLSAMPAFAAGSMSAA